MILPPTRYGYARNRGGTGIFWTWSLMAQVPLVFVWGPETLAGPWGAPAAFRQIPALDSSKTGCPVAMTFTAGADHWIVRQGIGVPGGTVKEQPLIVSMSVASRAELPPTLTFVWAVVSVACPPCGHWIVQPVSRILAPTG